MDEKTAKVEPLPLVVQLGFAGSRQLYDAKLHLNADAAAFEEEVSNWLAERLGRLKADLRLEEHHFFCGISALAIGGDTAFSRACRAAGIVQRIFLPQTRDAFFDAQGTEGPDFPLPGQKEAALRLLESPHVIQERVVSDAAIRAERFDDVNREIVRVSDVLICLVRANAQPRPGGTAEVMARAVLRGKPVLVVEVDVAAGKPVMNSRWKLPLPEGVAAAAAGTEPVMKIDPPKAPATLENTHLEDAAGGSTPIARYAGAVKKMASPTAERMQTKFRRLAQGIIWAHIAATILAAAALGLALAFAKFEGVAYLLGLELVMLAGGMVAHQWLNGSRVSHQWAEARLLAEVARSVIAIGRLHVYMRHLFLLPFPRSIRPLLRTINVLHLQSTRSDKSDWKAKRDLYIEKRLRMPKYGQIDFYGGKTEAAEKRLNRLHRAFFGFWVMATVATAAKLGLHSYVEAHPEMEWLPALLGTLAIVMPVLAAAALSLAAALDLEAQEHTYKEMREFLERQELNLRNATSEREYADLVLETEAELLGETANWFSRRSFVTVA